jgi:exopolyphosphatase/guanosine-5'-triphosphate,3'-diphosphate pyrophosphatase
LHRYRNKREGTRFEDLYALLDKAHQNEAEVLGKALRFGAMLWTLTPGEEGPQLSWDPDNRNLRLHLDPATEQVFGEVTEARFKSLAEALNADSHYVETP